MTWKSARDQNILGQDCNSCKEFWKSASSSRVGCQKMKDLFSGHRDYLLRSITPPRLFKIANFP